MVLYTTCVSVQSLGTKATLLNLYNINSKVKPKTVNCAKTTEEAGTVREQLVVCRANT